MIAIRIVGVWLLAALVPITAGCVSQPCSCTVAPNQPAPVPHTLPEAVCAYLHCLRNCPCNKDYGAAKGDGDSKEKEGKKDPEGTAGQKVEEKNGMGEGEKEKEKNGEKEKKGEEKKSMKDGQVRRISQDEKKDKDEDKTKDVGKDKEKEGEREDKAKDDKKEDDKDKDEKKEEDKATWFSAHGQATVVTQIHDPFRSPYVGAHSLVPVEGAATSETTTLFFAARIWEGGDIVFNPEVAGGRGFSGTTGLAGFTNGEITRVGDPSPTPYLARLFFRQTIGLGGEQEKVEDAANLIAGQRDVNRLTITAGKMSATDLADDNRYSHDPRTQFLDWALMFNGAWDYPANVRGYTYGIGLDYNTKDWALRYGIFMEPNTSNGATLDSRILKANGSVLEYERRYECNEHPGRLRLLSYLNNAHMGNYRAAVAEMPVDPDIADARAYRVKYGFGLNVEQEVTKTLGVFARLGWNDGHTESWAFTEIDQTAALGAVLKGNCWCRPRDEVGLAGVINGLSSEHKDYLAAGGLGFIIGDGRLSYGPEEILELYYNCEIIKGMYATADFQEVNHPAYNRDRGPVAVGTLRVHFEF